MVLKSGVVGDGEIDEILQKPEDYIDSVQYISWERFFTSLLIERTQNNGYMRYSKTNLPEYYLIDGSVERISGIIPQEIRDLF